MEPKHLDELSSGFLALVDLIQRLVSESQSKNEFSPSYNQMQRWKVLEHQKTETGINISRYQIEYFNKPDWHRGIFSLEKN